MTRPPSHNIVYFSRPRWICQKKITTSLGKDAGIIPIVAEKGMGRSTFVQHLSRTVGQKHQLIALTISPHLRSFPDTIEQVLKQLSVQCRRSFSGYQDFGRFLTELHQEGRSLCLFLDDADRLDDATFQNWMEFASLGLEMQSSSYSNFYPLQVFCVGNEEFYNKLKTSVSSSILKIAYHLPPLLPEEINIWFKLMLKNHTDRSNIDPEALRSFIDITKGYPKLMTILFYKIISDLKAKETVTTQRIQTASEFLLQKFPALFEVKDFTHTETSYQKIYHKLIDPVLAAFKKKPIEIEHLA